MPDKAEFKHYVGEDRRRKFLAALRVMPSIRKAAAAADIKINHLSVERNSNPEFQAEIKQILDERDQQAEDVVTEWMLKDNAEAPKWAVKWLELRQKAPNEAPPPAHNITVKVVNRIGNGSTST